MRKISNSLVLVTLLCGLIILAGATRTQVSASNEEERKSTSKNSIHFYVPHEPIIITNDKNFTDYGFPGLGTVEEPYIIENYNITTSNNEGIYINDTTKHFVIRNCYVDAESRGIQISYIAKGTASIIHNTCTNNDYGIYLYSSSGIFLSHSSGVILTNNTCNNNYYGIWLWNSSSAMLTDSICSNNKGLGIRLHSSSSATLTSNTCNNNDDGIYLHTCSGATLTSNTCNNNNYAFVLLNSSRLTLTNNVCNNNERRCILLNYNLYDSIIHHNSFIDNNLGGTSQAYDEGINNTWYEEETEEGNHWSDWRSKKPYLIDGDANATDPYPLNKNLERIDYGYTLVIPALILVAILLKRKKNTYSRP